MQRPRDRAHGWLLCCALLGVVACDRAPSAERVAEAMPERLGAFRADGEARRAETGGHVVFVRHYVAGPREASLRVLDARHGSDVARAFQTSLSLSEDTLDELSKPTVVEGERASLSWSRSTGESAIEVRVAERYLLSLNVWPASTRDEAERLFPDALVREARDAAGSR